MPPRLTHPTGTGNSHPEYSPPKPENGSPHLTGPFTPISPILVNGEHSPSRSGHFDCILLYGYNITYLTSPLSIGVWIVTMLLLACGGLYRQFLVRHSQGTISSPPFSPAAQ